MWSGGWEWFLTNANLSITSFFVTSSRILVSIGIPSHLENMANREGDDPLMGVSHLRTPSESWSKCSWNPRNIRPVSRLGWASSRKMQRMTRPCLMSLLVLPELKKSSSTNSCQPKLVSPSGFRIQSCPEAELGGDPGWQMQEWQRCER